eukprot:6182701-Pleurochrysis_carterae.AAC.1
MRLRTRRAASDSRCLRAPLWSFCVMMLRLRSLSRSQGHVLLNTVGGGSRPTSCSFAREPALQRSAMCSSEECF